ncbi:MAG: hypothetical protein EOP66_00210 [Sphingomonas sp.]|nr:MAG: hypothetical protein EOP66_00210 [Sphingomonas sp.]
MARSRGANLANAFSSARRRSVLEAPRRQRVCDLSDQGMRIEQPAPLHVGATVLVAVGQLEAVAASIVRIMEGSAGVEFAKPSTRTRREEKRRGTQPHGCKQRVGIGGAALGLRRLRRICSRLKVIRRST